MVTKAIKNNKICKKILEHVSRKQGFRLCFWLESGIISKKNERGRAM